MEYYFRSKKILTIQWYLRCHFECIEVEVNVQSPLIADSYSLLEMDFCNKHVTTTMNHVIFTISEQVYTFIHEDENNLEQHELIEKLKHDYHILFEWDGQVQVILTRNYTIN